MATNVPSAAQPSSQEVNAVLSQEKRLRRFSETDRYVRLIDELQNRSYHRRQASITKSLPEPFHSKGTFRSLLTPFELAPPARTVIGDNGLKEVQKGALVDGFILTDLNRPCCQVPLSLVNNALGIGHDGVVDENGEMILRSQQRADVAIQRKIGLL